LYFILFTYTTLFRSVTKDDNNHFLRNAFYIVSIITLLMVISIGGYYLGASRNNHDLLGSTTTLNNQLLQALEQRQTAIDSCVKIDRKSTRLNSSHGS